MVDPGTTRHSVLEDGARGDTDRRNRIWYVYEKFISSLIQKGRIPQNDHDDVKQEVFQKVYASLPNWRRDKFRAWLRTVCRTTCIDFHRRNNRAFLTGVDVEVECESSDQDDLEVVQRAMDLAKTTSSDRDWRIFCAWCAGDDSPAIAKRECMTNTATRKVLSRVRSQVRQAMGDELE